jgi:hypothetical protein
MGSSGSKATTSCSSSSSSSCRLQKGRSKRYIGFPSYCLGTASGSRDSDNDDQVCFLLNFLKNLLIFFL